MNQPLLSRQARLAGALLLFVLGAPALRAQDAPPQQLQNAVPTAGASAPSEQPDVTPERKHEKVDPYADLPTPTGKQAPGQDEHKSADVQQLKGVEVQGKHDLLHEQDKRLKALQDSLPCAGCDVPPRKKKLARRVIEKAVDLATPQPAPDKSHEVNDKAQDYSQEGQCIGAVDARRCAPGNAQP